MKKFIDNVKKDYKETSPGVRLAIRIIGVIIILYFVQILFMLFSMVGQPKLIGF